MTYWWSIFPVVAIIVTFWLICDPLYDALHLDRAWSSLHAFALTQILAIGDLNLLSYAAPKWGWGRLVLAPLICFALLHVGALIHKHQTGKRVITLPKKS